MKWKQFWPWLVAAFSATDLFRTKSLDALRAESEEPQHQLRRTLGPVQLTLFGIGAIIGAGIFATIGTAAAGDSQRPGAGPALMVSFVLTAIVCGFTALCYAEFASTVPISGSAYTYAYASLGEVIAWIIGWDLIIEYAVGNIAVAISWANYFKTLLKGFGVTIPEWLTMDYRTAAKTQFILENGDVTTVLNAAPAPFGFPIVINVLAIGIVALITILLVVGIRESAWFNAVMVGIKIVVLLFFIIAGMYWVKPDNWQPFEPNGWAGISAGAAVVFFAYIGFDAVSTVAEETKEPQRNLPIGILGSLIICTIFYVIVSAVFTGLISYKDLTDKLATEQAEPLTMALDHAVPKNLEVTLFGRPFSWANLSIGIVAFGSVIAHTAVLLVFQLGQPRIFMAMSRDGLLPPLFARVHPVFRTPHVATILTGIIVASTGAFANIEEMVDLTNIGTLFAFILVCAGIIVLRVKDPDHPRPFRVPGGWPWALGLAVVFGFVWVYLAPPSILIRDLKVKGEVAVNANALLLKAGGLVVGGIVFFLARNHIFPVLGVITCAYLGYYLPPTSWLRFAAWLNIGFVIYVGYGAVHSHLTGRQHSADPAQHDASTAHAGAWLALLGAILLVVTHAFDLMEGRKADQQKVADLAALVSPIDELKPWLPDLHDPIQDVSALWAIVEPQGWLTLTGNIFLSEMFWFMVLPLALNAFLLCPIVVVRARRARQEGVTEVRTHAPGRSILLAAVLAGVIVVYFVGVVLYSAGAAKA